MKYLKGGALWAGIALLVSGTHFDSRIAVILGSAMLIFMAIRIFEKETQE